MEGLWCGYFELKTGHEICCLQLQISALLSPEVADKTMKAI
jgi:hypothetical protein